MALLQALEAAGQPEAVIPAWAAVHAVHVSLRYVALRSLRFPYPNQARRSGRGRQLLMHRSRQRLPCRLHLLKWCTILMTCALLFVPALPSAEARRRAGQRACRQRAGAEH